MTAHARKASDAFVKSTLSFCNLINNKKLGQCVRFSDETVRHEYSFFGRDEVLKWPDILVTSKGRYGRIVRDFFEHLVE